MEAPAGCDVRGVYFKDAAWHASATIRNKKCYIGSFSSSRAAAIARDMELLRCLGEDAAEELNFEYEIEKSTATELVVVDSRGAHINIMLQRDGDYFPVVREPSKKAERREVLTAPIVVPSSWPQLSYNHIPWADRTQTASVISAAFSYEVEFPFQSSLGLNLKPHSIMYSQSGGGSFVGCLTVLDATQYLSTVIRPGDVLLRVNDKDLVFPGHEFEFEKTTKIIMNASTPRVLRLMRAHCPGEPPSPAEVLALARSQLPIAKFTIVSRTDARGVESQDRALQLVSSDVQLPISINKQLQGADIPYNFCNMPKPPIRPPKITSRPKITKATEDTFDGEETYVVTGTIYRDRVYSAGGPGAAAFANGGGSAPNGGGLVNSVLGGLMISNSSVVQLGKWCAYVQIITLKNYSSTCSEPEAGTISSIGFTSTFEATQVAKEQLSKAKKTRTQVLNCAPRRYFVGKFDSEHDAKMNMNLVFITN